MHLITSVTAVHLKSRQVQHDLIIVSIIKPERRGSDVSKETTEIFYWTFHLL